MSRSDAARYADTAARVQNQFAYYGDRSMGRAGAWRQDAEHDAPTRYARVTAFRRNDSPVPARPAAPPVPVRPPASTSRAAGDRSLGTIVVKAVAPAVDNPAELVAARASFLSVLKNRQAVLEREEADRQAAEAERIRVEAEAEQVRRDAEAARLREERERLAREEAVLRQERGRLVELMRTVDMGVFDLMWPGQSFVRERLIAWVQTLDIGSVRNVHGSLVVETRRHQEAKARAEDERRRAEAAAAKLNPKKKGFDLLTHLRSKAADPVAPVRPPPSKEELAERERQINGEGKKETVIYYTEDPKRSLRERIELLDPTVIARLHSQKPAVYIRVGWPVRLEQVVHTWPSIDRLLNALKGARTKIDGKVVDDGAMIGRIKVFVAWCEQG